MVDPVMGDHGKAYKAYTPLMQDCMKELISKADIITPNLTEASMLLGIDYPQHPLELSELRDMLLNLKALTKGDIVITGLKIAGNSNLINGCYDSKCDKLFAVAVAPIPASSPGTGDLFASVLMGGLVKKRDLAECVSLATSFRALSVDTTYITDTYSR